MFSLLPIFCVQIAWLKIFIAVTERKQSEIEVCVCVLRRVPTILLSCVAGGCLELQASFSLGFIWLVGVQVWVFKMHILYHFRNS